MISRSDATLLREPAYWRGFLQAHDTLSLDDAADRATLARAIAASIRDHALGAAYAEGYAEGYEETQP